MPNQAIEVYGKKFMWDGEFYPTEADASEKLAQYQKNSFEAVCLNKEGKPLIYTRRVVTEGGEAL